MPEQHLGKAEFIQLLEQSLRGYQCNCGSSGPLSCDDDCFSHQFGEDRALRRVVILLARYVLQEEEHA